jgi:hypothetical protein
MSVNTNTCIKNLDVDKLTAFLDADLHLKGLHAKGYNNIFRNFITKNIDKIRTNPMFLIGFAAGVMKNVGLGDAWLNPAAY